MLFLATVLLLIAPSSAVTINDSFRCNVCIAFVGEVDRALQVYCPAILRSISPLWSLPRPFMLSQAFHISCSLLGQFHV